MANKLVDKKSLNTKHTSKTTSASNISMKKRIRNQSDTRRVFDRSVSPSNARLASAKATSHPLFKGVILQLKETMSSVGNVLQTRQPLNKKYDFRPKEKVRSFLIKYPFLIKILDDAFIEIRKAFPNDPLHLEFYRDPENFRFTQLFIVIMSDGEPVETLQKLSQLEDDWWMDNINRAKNKLSITVSYR
jgi:hypothetical protein